MKKIMNPFDLTGFISINADKAKSVGLGEITSQDWFEGQSTKPHPNGIFSAEIFGAIGTTPRFLKWGYIDIKADILHPHLYKDICSMNHFYSSVISGKVTASFDNSTKTLIPDISENSGTGYSFFMKHLPKIVFESTGSKIRDEKVELLNKSIKSGDYTTSALLVIPAAMRDVDTSEQHPSADEINDFYTRMLSISRTIDQISYKVDPSVYDTQSIGLLKCFTELYEYILNILSGKNGFMYAKLYSRNIQMGTRNVATAMPIYVEDASEEGFTNQHTFIGLYQYLQGTAPRAVYEIRNKIINGKLDDYDIQSLVTNIKTLKAERVKLTQSQFDRYSSKEGLMSLFNYYEHRKNRWKIAMVSDKHCISLIYDDGYRIRLLSDIEELPDGFDKQFVRPINYTEMLTYCCYHSSKDTICIPTRYPVATEGSTFLSYVYMLVTSEYSKRILLDDNWQESNIEFDRWPNKDSDFFDGMSVHSSKMSKLALDFDGDMLNCNFLLSQESVAEAKKIMSSKYYHFKTGGDDIWSPDTSTTDFVMNNLTME
jgi:hypothetical protein